MFALFQAVYSIYQKVQGRKEKKAARANEIALQDSTGNQPHTSKDTVTETAEGDFSDTNSLERLGQLYYNETNLYMSEIQRAKIIAEAKVSDLEEIMDRVMKFHHDHSAKNENELRFQEEEKNRLRYELISIKCFVEPHIKRLEEAYYSREEIRALEIDNLSQNKPKAKYNNKKTEQMRRRKEQFETHVELYENEYLKEFKRLQYRYRHLEVYLEFIDSHTLHSTDQWPTDVTTRVMDTDVGPRWLGSTPHTWNYPEDYVVPSNIPVTTPADQTNGFNTTQSPTHRSL